MDVPQRVPAGVLLIAILIGMLLTAGGAALSLAQEEEAPQDPPHIEKQQVDEACAVSRVHLAVYEDAVEAFNDANAEWYLVLEDIEIAKGRRDVALSLATRKAEEVEELRSELERTAIQLYMQQGVLSLAPLLGDTPADVIVGTHYLDTGTETQLAEINNYLSSQRDLDRHQQEIGALEVDLAELEQQRKESVDSLALTARDQYGAYAQLDEQCQELVKQWEAQEARRRAEEARRRAEEARLQAIAAAAEARRREQARLQAIARASRQGEGVGPIPGLVCPFPGSAFVDSWGDPRSGGRTHRGVDMFGPYGGALYAVASGTVTIVNSGLGGRGIWLHSDTGVGYYYAHLSDWAVSEGDRVSPGQVVAYNGDSGNAEGGPPHLHLQLHPSGRGTPAYNPYPTMRAAC
ncbi:MAG: peptidoglycan DD-metalloendopeptidase family protein [Actinomycetia bacterium]|nr:peptidoglycan DD-metalloendopeptidase family protein [Actinomycetes bacterium]